MGDCVSHQSTCSTISIAIIETLTRVIVNISSCTDNGNTGFGS